jgi:hypothetical protein
MALILMVSALPLSVSDLPSHPLYISRNNAPPPQSSLIVQSIVSSPSMLASFHDNEHDYEFDSYDYAPVID